MMLRHRMRRLFDRRDLACRRIADINNLAAVIRYTDDALPVREPATAIRRRDDLDRQLRHRCRLRDLLFLRERELVLEVADLSILRAMIRTQLRHFLAEPMIVGTQRRHRRRAPNEQEPDGVTHVDRRNRRPRRAREQNLSSNALSRCFDKRQLEPDVAPEHGVGVGRNLGRGGRVLERTAHAVTHLVVRERTTDAYRDVAALVSRSRSTVSSPCAVLAFMHASTASPAFIVIAHHSHMPAPTAGSFGWMYACRPLNSYPNSAASG